MSQPILGWLVFLACQKEVSLHERIESVSVGTPLPGCPYKDLFCENAAVYRSPRISMCRG